MYTIYLKNTFKKDIKKIKKRNLDINLLDEVISKLEKGEQLDEKYNDHLLKGNYIGCRECHIAPDWLLVYRIKGDKLILVLSRTGSHSDLF